MSIIKKIMTSKNTKTILMTTSILTILAILIVPATLSNEAEATHRNDRCHGTGADGVKSKCYATQHFSVDNTKVITAFKGKIAATDLDIPKGVNQASYWLKFTSGEFIEIGITDLAGTNKAQKFMCGINGGIETRTWRTTPASGTTYNLQVSDYNLDGTWNVRVNNERCTSVLFTSIPMPKLLGIERGTETSYNNMNDFVQEFDKTKLRVDGKWKYLGSSIGVQQTQSKVTNGYFVDKCGGTTEKFYHIETGKGVKRNC